MQHKGVFECIFFFPHCILSRTIASHIPGHLKRRPDFTLEFSSQGRGQEVSRRLMLRAASVCFLCTETMRPRKWSSSRFIVLRGRAKKGRLSFLFLLSFSCPGSVATYEKGSGESKKRRGRRKKVVATFNFFHPGATWTAILLTQASA